MASMAKVLGAGIVCIALAFAWQYVLKDGDGRAATAAQPISFSEVSMPSPVVSYLENMICPLCSPPMRFPVWTIFS